MGKIITGSRIILAGSVLYFIDSFIPWNRACRVLCVSFTLWHGVGIFAAMTATALAVWEAAPLIGRRPYLGLPPHDVSFGGATLTAFFTLLKVIVDASFLWVGAWIGLALAAAIGYGGYLRVTEVRPKSPPTESAEVGQDDG
jgi:hypothetical protein